MPAARKKKTVAAAPAPGPAEWWVEVVPFDAGDDVHRIGPYANKRLAERAESGVTRNLDDTRFCTRVTSGPAGKP
jgi:hypothetical protein